MHTASLLPQNLNDLQQSPVCLPQTQLITCHAPTVPISAAYQCQSGSISTANQCPAVLPISAHQCCQSVLISAANLYPSVFPVSVHQYWQSVLISAASISAAYQCPSLPPISAHQCRISVQPHQCLLINDHQCCLISVAS
ncbi:unnamed protein product [Staurois parvus]|uniref:Uncharacterized protein n=1 Tax=Staurois parvus TaxID=386267 RepID=A0ABN9D933_9NEOB|nr:unnamed protein product [Staurois parvus]